MTKFSSHRETFSMSNVETKWRLYRHDITEILLKVALSTNNPDANPIIQSLIPDR